MSGGTQVTTTTTQPWEKQEPYLEEGMQRGLSMLQGGQFSPEFYGAAGTQAPGAAAIGQVAPGVAGFAPQQQAAMDADAIGCGISGSGPSLFALSNSLEKAEKIGAAMVNSFKNVGLKSKAYNSPIHTKPTEILD